MEAVFMLNRASDALGIIKLNKFLQSEKADNSA